MQIPQLVQVPGQKRRKEALCHSGSAHSTTRPQPTSPPFLSYSFLIAEGIQRFPLSLPSIPLCCFLPMCLSHSISSTLYSPFNPSVLNFLKKKCHGPLWEAHKRYGTSPQENACSSSPSLFHAQGFRHPTLTVLDRSMSIYASALCSLS